MVSDAHREANFPSQHKVSKHGLLLCWALGHQHPYFSSCLMTVVSVKLDYHITDPEWGYTFMNTFMFASLMQSTIQSLFRKHQFLYIQSPRLSGIFWSDNPQSRKEYLLVMIGNFFRLCLLVPSPDKTAKTAVNAIIDELICKCTSSKVLSNNGRKFDNASVNEISKNFQYQEMQHHSLSHPSSNGLPERQ